MAGVHQKWSYALTWFFCFTNWTGIKSVRGDRSLLMRCSSVSFKSYLCMRLQSVIQKKAPRFSLGDPLGARGQNPTVSPYPPPIKDTSVLHDIFLLLSEHFTMFLLSERGQDIWQWLEHHKRPGPNFKGPLWHFKTLVELFSFTGLLSHCGEKVAL